jgi:hypothetical protein
MVPVRASVILDVTSVAPLRSVLSPCDKFTRNYQVTLFLHNNPPSVGLTILVTTKSGVKKQFYRLIYCTFCSVCIAQWGDTCVQPYSKLLCDFTWAKEIVKTGFYVMLTVHFSNI